MYKTNKYYKVVTEDMKSLGLRRNPNVMTFIVGECKHEPTPLKGNMDHGGIWCTHNLSNAKRLKKYFEGKYGIARIFECEIGEVLFKNSYRLKTDKVLFKEEIFV